MPESVVNAPTISTLDSVPSAVPASLAHSSAAATTTLSSTTFLTSTKVITLNHHSVAEPAQPSSPIDGPYSFAEENGSTIWLGGKTPTSGAILVTDTLVVTLQPQPSSTETVSFTTASETVLTSKDGTTTSWTTLSSTSFYTHYLTNVLSFATVATSLPAPNLSAYLGNNGWNATLTTLQTLPSGVAITKPSDVQSKDPQIRASAITPTRASDTYRKTPAAWSSSGQVTASVAFPLKRLHPRQVGAIVTATINGVVVTWTNVWAGDPITTKPATSTEIPISNPAIPSSATTSPEYTWDPNPLPWTSIVTQPESTSPRPSFSPQASSSVPWTSGTTAASAPPTSLFSTFEPPSVTSSTWNPSPKSTTTQAEFSTFKPSSAGQPSSVLASIAISSLASALETKSLSSNAEPSSTSTSTQTGSSTSSVVPVPRFPNATQTNPATTTPESTCGADTGRFTIDFDDLPQFSADGNNTDIPPIFNPYRKLYFNGGYGYVPPPDDPFAPISPPQLAVYNYHTDSSTSQSIDAGLELHGELGAGPRFHESAYWIDAYSAWIGCANSGPSDCQVDIIGYDAFNTPIAYQTLLQPPCPGLVNCKLAQITFSNEFQELAGLQILAYVNKIPVTFYMDDLSLGWSNNTCAAQFERSSSP
ncbi:MAG: hypothetical protein Q9172_005235 [Xanthocarpia lactea]